MLPRTLPTLWRILDRLIVEKCVAANSFALYVNDGSTDETWAILEQAAQEDPNRIGAISLSHNRGHQQALLAGLMHARNYSDITISLDADLQDDPEVIRQMVEAYHQGYDVVCGVRDDRTSDSRFKRDTAQVYYKLMKRLGVELIYNHADYRLLSKPVLEALSGYREVNLFLRGLIPQLGFRTTLVNYARTERTAGESKYTLGKMLSLAWNGVTSFTVTPLRLVTLIGAGVFLVSIIMAIWILVRFLMGETVAGWSSVTMSIWGIGGLLLLSIGVVGEYIGKIYLESKGRPRYHIAASRGAAETEQTAEDDQWMR